MFVKTVKNSLKSQKHTQAYKEVCTVYFSKKLDRNKKTKISLNCKGPKIRVKKIVFGELKDELDTEESFK